jgi:hypothetical protein
MSKRTSRIVENPSGIGKITKNDVSINVLYNITVKQEYIDNIPAQQDIRGRISFLPEAKPLFLDVGEQYTLHIDDGRQMEILLFSGNFMVGFQFSSTGPNGLIKK